jgi:hypothetical protein
MNTLTDVVDAEYHDPSVDGSGPDEGTRQQALAFRTVAAAFSENWPGWLAGGTAALPGLIRLLTQEANSYRAAGRPEPLPGRRLPHTPSAGGFTPAERRHIRWAVGKGLCTRAQVAAAMFTTQRQIDEIVAELPYVLARAATSNPADCVATK